MGDALLRALDPGSAVVASWILTFLVHGTLLLGAAWLVVRVRDLRPAWEETLWRVALFAPVLTATAHAVADVDPLVDAWDVTLLHPASGAASAGGAGAAAPGLLAGLPALLLDHWQLALVASWAAGAGLQVVRLVRRNRRLLAALGDRRPATGRRGRILRASLAAVGAAPGVRLRVLEGIGTPLALGLREVVVPPDLVDRMADAPLRGVLAHEVAHLARRDPLWSLAAATVRALCFFQPLCAVARRRLEELAEIRADAWAIERTGEPLAVARGLEAVASALSGGPRPATAGLAAAGERRAGLLARVSRILEPAPGEGRAVPAGLRAVLVAAVLGLALLALPSFTPLHDRDDDALRARASRSGALAVRGAAAGLGATSVPARHPARTSGT
ncbi:MAG TPA: M56 family metallopeptidase [Gemmatimonadota bacterium]|nr:M56 family metallopeptidase [Gemmatimonadota bacterium]